MVQTSNHRNASLLLHSWNHAIIVNVDLFTIGETIFLILFHDIFITVHYLVENTTSQYYWGLRVNYEERNTPIYLDFFQIISTVIHVGTVMSITLWSVLIFIFVNINSSFIKTMILLLLILTNWLKYAGTNVYKNILAS